MKDKKWFKEACYQYAQTTESLVDFIERIYTQGRADQNEADVKVVKGYTKVHPLSWQYTPSALAAAIRAAGPEVGE